MNFCPSCGHKTNLLIPQGDNRLRDVCSSCGKNHYKNPRIIAGCLVVWEGKVLLCKRAINPRKGYWTLPAGFMEIDETIEQAARRETIEEANAHVKIEQLYSIFNLPQIGQVYMIYLSSLLVPDFSSGPESLETKLFSEDEIPWDDLAFETMRHSLAYYFSDRKKGRFTLRTTDVYGP